MGNFDAPAMSAFYFRDFGWVEIRRIRKRIPMNSRQLVAMRTRDRLQ
jgi:hypothetical protein